MHLIKKTWLVDDVARKQIVKGVFWSFWASVFDVIPDILIALTINFAILKDGSFLHHIGLVSNLSTAYGIATIVFISLIAQIAAQFLSTLGFKRAARLTQLRLLCSLWRCLLDLRLETNETGVELVNSYQQQAEELEIIEGFIGRTLEDGCKLLFSSLIIGSILLYVEPKFLLYVVLPLLPVFFLTRVQQKKMAPYNDKVKRALRHIHEECDVLVRLSSDSYDENYRRFTDKAYLIGQTRDRAFSVNSAIISAIRISIRGGFLLILLHGVSMVFHHEISIGTFVATIFLSRKFLQSFSGLNGLINAYQRGLEAITQFTIEFPHSEALSAGNAAVCETKM